MNHATEASIGNIEQNLIELIADFLDSESVTLEEATGRIEDPLPRIESELHIEMAKAAIEVYKKKVQYPLY
jgi:hypothetical protein